MLALIQYQNKTVFGLNCLTPLLLFNANDCRRFIKVDGRKTVILLDSGAGISVAGSVVRKSINLLDKIWSSKYSNITTAADGQHYETIFSKLSS